MCIQHQYYTHNHRLGQSYFRARQRVRAIIAPEGVNLTLSFYPAESDTDDIPIARQVPSSNGPILLDRTCCTEPAVLPLSRWPWDLY